jgi:hypothetical protein
VLNPKERMIMIVKIIRLNFYKNEMTGEMVKDYRDDGFSREIQISDESGTVLFRSGPHHPHHPIFSTYEGKEYIVPFECSDKVYKEC